MHTHTRNVRVRDTQGSVPDLLLKWQTGAAHCKNALVVCDGGAHMACCDGRRPFSAPHRRTSRPTASVNELGLQRVLIPRKDSRFPKSLFQKIRKKLEGSKKYVSVRGVANRTSQFDGLNLVRQLFLLRQQLVRQKRIKFVTSDFLLCTPMFTAADVTKL